MTHRIMGMVSAGILLILLLNPGTVTADVNNFSFSSFDGEYRLSMNEKGVGELLITEKLEAKFPNFDQNRGIERAIPTTYNGKKINPQIVSVQKPDGTKWNYTTRNENDNLILRIGDANIFVRGQQTYVITYKVSNVITFYENYDELFWDVNGDQWRQSFERVRARVYLDPSLTQNLRKERACYTGSFGSTNRLCKFVDEADQNGTSILIVANQRLRPGENLSFALTFNTGTFQKQPENPLVIAGWILSGVILGLALPAVIFFLLYRRWRTSGKDPKIDVSIVPEYKPPKHVQPLVADVVLTQKKRTVAISAAIMNLCVHKYISVYETTKSKLLGTKTSYELELISVPPHLSPEERTLLDKLFPGLKHGSKANLTELKQKLYGASSTIHKQAEQNAVKLGFYKQTPTKARGYFALGGSLLIAAGVGLLFIPVVKVGAPGPIISGIIMLFFGFLMPARTEKGLRTKHHLEGLKMYMQLAEADRIRTLQSPKGSEKTTVKSDNKSKLIKIYEELLPYAILFGIEKQWAKELSQLYSEPPTWYHSNQAFNAAIFSQAIQNVNNANLNSFSAPSSSGSSGVSGGGFSGGGGGGGGGGGW